MSTEALSIYIDPTNKAKLAEIYGGIIGNIQKKTISQVIKSTNFSGDPGAGTLKFKRFTNAESKTYGTARTAGKGEKIKAPETIVNIDIKREIVEEANKGDVDKFGVASLVERRKSNHQLSMIKELEKEFFLTAYEAGSEFSPTATDSIDILEEAIIKLETTKNEFIDGVPKDLMVVICSPTFYSKIRKYLDTLPTNKVDISSEDFALYHGVKIYSSIYLPTGVLFELMVLESIAQPVTVYPYDAEKIPLSNDVAIELYYDYGCEALSPDVILYVTEDDATLNELTITSTEDGSGKTLITVAGDTGLENRKLIYKINSTTAPTVTFNQTLTTGWALLTDANITTTDGYKIGVAEVTADNKAKAYGTATVVAGA